jgi:hypothetical protein
MFPKFIWVEKLDFALNKECELQVSEEKVPWIYPELKGTK